MIYLKTAEEIELMQDAATLVSRTLGEIAKWVAHKRACLLHFFDFFGCLKINHLSNEKICGNRVNGINMPSRLCGP